MANQLSVHDGNNSAGLIAHSGTAGTAETVRVVAQYDGSLLVGNEGAAVPLVGIDLAHYEVHEGDHYFVQGFATVGEGTSVDFTVTTGTVDAHMMFSYSSSFQADFYMYENSTLGTGGATVTPINSNRNSTNTSSLTLRQGQEVGTLGNLLLSSSIGGTINSVNKWGGQANRDDEIILKNSEDYLFRITSRSNGNIISYHGYWYEHNV